MVSNSWKWVAVSEPAKWNLEDGELFAAVARDGSSIGAVLAERDGSLLDVSGEFSAGFGGVIGANALAVETGLQAPWPSPRVDFGVALSSTEHALFVIGGTDADGNPLHDIWRFDIRLGTWSELRFAGAMPGRVLSATYRPNDRSLYVLDDGESEGGWGQERRGRLLRLDVRARQGSVVGEWKRKTGFEHHYLSNASRGELILVGSSDTKERYRGVRFSYSPNNGLAILGWFQGKGFIAARPTLTERGLTLPLGVAGEVTNSFRPREDLEGGPPHSFAECL